jgi:hypothetical protein
MWRRCGRWRRRRRQSCGAETCVALSPRGFLLGTLFATFSAVGKLPDMGVQKPF